MIAINYHYLIIIITYVIRKKLFQFFIPYLHSDKGFVKNPLNFENNIQSKRHFVGQIILYNGPRKINSHVCFSNIIIETKKRILFFRTSHIY